MNKTKKTDEKYIFYLYDIIEYLECELHNKIIECYKLQEKFK